MSRALMLLLCVAGCAVDPCANKPGACIALEIRAGGGVPQTLNQVGVRATAGFSFGEGARELRRPDPAGKPLSLPAFLAVLPPVDFQGGDFTLLITGFAADEPVATQTVESAVALPAGRARLTVVLAAIGALGDMGGGGNPDFAGGPCDPIQQLGCNPGQKCTASISDGKLSCVTDRTTAVGELCSPNGVPPQPTTETCKKGLWCTPDAQLGLFHACRQFCAVNADCTQPPVLDADNLALCNFEISGAPKLHACSIVCDPLANTGCSDGTSCRVITTLPEFTDCVADRGVAAEGDACGNGCSDGLSCFKNVCRKPCLLGSPACAAGRSCTAPSSGLKPFGFCCPGGSC